MSIYDVTSNFKELIVNHNENLLFKLYVDQFELRYGKGAEAVSCFKDDYILRTSGYGVPLPIDKEK